MLLLCQARHSRYKLTRLHCIVPKPIDLASSVRDRGDSCLGFVENRYLVARTTSSTDLLPEQTCACGCFIVLLVRSDTLQTP